MPSRRSVLGSLAMVGLPGCIGQHVGITQHASEDVCASLSTENGVDLMREWRKSTDLLFNVGSDNCAVDPPEINVEVDGNETDSTAEIRIDITDVKRVQIFGPDRPLNGDGNIISFSLKEIEPHPRGTLEIDPLIYQLGKCADIIITGNVAFPTDATSNREIIIGLVENDQTYYDCLSKEIQFST